MRPEAEHYTVRLLEGTTGDDLDIIKLTTQFVAHNGKSFLTGLTSGEENNPLFHFLKPTHGLLIFYTALADSYSKVLMPAKGLTDKLKKSVADVTTVLDGACTALSESGSGRRQDRWKRRRFEQEWMQMAIIDQHDFAVVATIEFANGEDDEFLRPMTLEEVIKRTKTSAVEEEADEPGKEVEMAMAEEEVQLVQEGTRAAGLDENDNEKENEPEPPMRIVKNWKRPQEPIPTESDPPKFVASPITRELIPMNKVAEHVRISLIDPKYKEQKERMLAKIWETTLAYVDEISRNIVGLARTHPDIFSTTKEEVSNALKAEIEKKKEEPK